MGIVGNPFSRLAEGEGRIVIASAKPNQRSWEDPGLGHGIFTFHLIDALHGKADADNDGYVSVMEIFKYLERNVPQSVRLLANSVQEPLLCGDITKDIILTADTNRVAEIAALQEKAELRSKKEVQEKKNKLFDLHNRGDLPLDAFKEALTLIEKSPASMFPDESQLAEFLETLLKDGISPKLYMQSRNVLLLSRTRELKDRSLDKGFPESSSHAAKSIKKMPAETPVSQVR